ncbi:MAG: tRNA (adenosine(37)-N6)-threonylcarbamoyltransferase complex transferase subunit TsaD [bacterium]|nr:tRNA (adenosine(37)-N6)-threonylcarbamoyltransferase complex transferase subunit TsaD [bacterium]
MYVLGVESSCDETAAAVLRFEGESEADAGPRVLSSIVASQEDLHSRFGGVVPELASRRHVECIGPVIEEALRAAQVPLEKIDALAVTRGPGLVIALLVGLSAAKGLAWARGLPLVGVHHLEGHIFSLFLERDAANGDMEAAAFGGPPPFPHLAFVISGGHTDLYRVAAGGGAAHLGGTLDDAAGEAYDKVAASMGLGYPGGAALDQLHRAFIARGGTDAPEFPRPFLEDRPYSFSFSGLKTAVLNYLREGGYLRSDKTLAPWDRPQPIPEEVRERVAAGFQEAAVEVLAAKVDGAAKALGLGAVSVCGGVAANRCLRHRLMALSERSGWTLHLPARKYCTDNAAMIACAGGYALLREGREAFMDYLEMDADPAWELGG